MIIDVLLDRRYNLINYDAATHLRAIYDCAMTAGMTDLTAAINGGNEKDIKAALMHYVIYGGCNPDIYHYNMFDLCLFINRVRWTSEDEEESADTE